MAGIFVAAININPFTPKGSPFDEKNRLALGRVSGSERVKGDSCLSRPTEYKKTELRLPKASKTRD